MKTIRDATTILGMLERGDAAASLSDEISSTLIACQDAAGAKGTAKGEVVVKLKFSVQGASVEIEADISSKRPKMKRPRSFLFLTPSGELSLEHPQQISMFDGPRPVSSREA